MTSHYSLGRGSWLRRWYPISRATLAREMYPREIDLVKADARGLWPWIAIGFGAAPTLLSTFR